MGGVDHSSSAVRITVDDVALDTAAFAAPGSGGTPTTTPTATSTAAPATATPTSTSVPPTATPTAGSTATPTPTSSTRLRTVTLENTSGTITRTLTSPLKGTASFRVPNTSTGYGTITTSMLDAVWVTAYVRSKDVT